jgi:hypothetical protein
MARAKLKFDERELNIGEDETTFGRTSDNTVSFTDNANISRNHAEIKFSGGQYVVRDLGSSNGTTVNGQKIDGETALNNGDFITLGNSVVVEFVLEDARPEGAEEDYETSGNGADPIPEAQTADAGGKSSRLPVMLGVMGAVCGLAVVFAAAAVYVVVSSPTPECNATARFFSPVNGQTLTQETEIRVDVTDGSCVSVVHIVLNGKEIASLTEAPYTAQIDPKNYPDLADGGLYPLQIVLEDSEGNTIPQSREIALQFETKEIEPPPTVTPVTTTPTPKTPQGKTASLVEMQKMTAAVVAKYTGGNFKYNLSNPDFLREVQKKTADYAAAGYFQRAAAYQEKINLAFVREKNLDASLPYLLAMSRSRFNPEKQGANEGLWQMSNDFATANAYNVICGTQTLSEPTQECAAKATAIYLEDLVVKVFEGDLVYVVAAYGKSSQEALTWKAALPADRSDFWKVITDPAQREEIARFFAAAVVAENPQKFGLKNDRPISELYPPRTN